MSIREYSSESEDLFAGMRILKDEEQLCDFTVVINSQNFHTHKFLLASRSDYFKAMIINDTRESKAGRVELDDVEPDTMCIILEYLYTSKVTITIENVQNILMAASRFQMDELVSFCEDFIRDGIDLTNCLAVLSTADRCNLQDLFQSAFEFCVDHFKQVVEDESFTELDANLLRQIVESDDLNVDDEMFVFNGILKWYSSDVESRASQWEQLMQCVRFPVMKRNHLIEARLHESIENSKFCKDLIDYAKDYLLMENIEARTPPNTIGDSLRINKRPDHVRQISSSWYKRRDAFSYQQRIYAVGGWTNDVKPISQVERYNPTTDSWEWVQPMIRPRCGVGATFLDNSLYAVGGHDGGNYLSSVERYDIVDETWHTDVADMRYERTSLGVVAMNAYIYAIGGQVGQVATDKVERYDRATNQWLQCTCMNAPRLGAGVAVLNGLIYVVGGADFSFNAILNSVEVYDPRVPSWHLLSPMHANRKHLGCAVIDGKIYAVGGRSDGCELATVECYDPRNDSWTLVRSMSESRSGIGLVELDGLLYAVGGHNGDSRLRLVEAYDPKTDIWTTKKSMNHERLGGGLAVNSLSNKDNNRTWTITRSLKFDLIEPSKDLELE